MAKIETIRYNPNQPNDPEQKTEIINVTASVGANGVNQKEDVMVIQALLKYALEPRRYFRGTKFTEPTGAFTRATAELIKKYQRFNNKTESDKVGIDGRIDPLKGGIYMPGTRKFWTIYSLYVDALETALLSGHEDPIKEICRRWSSIGGILNNNSVGSLGLSLEPSNQGVGSLGLSLA